MAMDAHGTRESHPSHASAAGTRSVAPACPTHLSGDPLNETEGALSISTRPYPSGLVVLRLAGELDLYTGLRLRTAVADVLRGPGAGVIADLSGLDYCDSTGMTEIITAHHRAAEAGSSFSVAALSPVMAQLFRVAGLDQLLTLHASVEEALDALAPD